MDAATDPEKKGRASRVCSKCRATRSPRPVARAPRAVGGTAGRGSRVAARPVQQWRPGHDDPVPWQLQHMAITCEDAVRRIDELCAVTQHLLRELDVYGWEEPKETPPVPPANHVPQRVPPLLPQREREAPSEAETVSNQLLRSVSSYVPAPLGTRSVMLPCDRCIDMDAFTSTCTASAHDKHRIGHELQSGLLHQRLCAVYARVAADGHGLTWSRGRLRDFVRSCFAELQLQSPTEPQIYEVYSHFDPELQLASLTPLESICLCETLLRASLHGTADDSPVLLGDHPTKLAEKWVEDYVPLPVDGTVSIAYSTGVVIQFSDFAALLEPVAVANAEHRDQMLKTISSCQLLKNGLQVFQRCDGGSGYLSWPSEILRFVGEVFHQESYVPPTQQHVTPFFKKFAQGSKSKLNTSESLCLLDALCRAILHCHADSRGSAAERVAAPGATASTAASEGQGQSEASKLPPSSRGDTAKSTMVDAPAGPGATSMTNEVDELLVAKEVDRGDEPKALATARSWVESAAKNLPLFEGTLDLGPQQFASMALRVYCEHFAGLQRLRFRDSEELQHFVRLALTTTGALPAAQLQLALQAVTPLAEHIDLHGAGELDITQCLVLADGVLRWISEKDVASTTSSLPLFGSSVFLRGDPLAEPPERPKSSTLEAIGADADATNQVFRDAFAACDQGHGYLTWSEVKHFVAMVFRTLGTAQPSESDVYKLYARFDEEHTARLSLGQCIRLADAAVRSSG